MAWVRQSEMARNARRCGRVSGRLCSYRGPIRRTISPSETPEDTTGTLQASGQMIERAGGLGDGLIGDVAIDLV